MLYRPFHYDGCSRIIQSSVTRHHHFDFKLYGLVVAVSFGLVLQQLVLCDAHTTGCPFKRFVTQHTSTAERKLSVSSPSYSAPSLFKWDFSNVLRLSGLYRLRSSAIPNTNPDTAVNKTTEYNSIPRWSYRRLTELEATWTELQDWKTKLDKVWAEIVASPRIANPWPTVLEFFFRLILQGDDFTRLRLPLTFRPYGNDQKVLHSGGSFGKIRVHWNDVEFRARHTGLFSHESIDGIMSASGGNPYVGNQSAAYGWGFKFFRTNQTPATILTLNAFLGGGAYWNTFGYMTCNHASIAEMGVLAPTLIGWSRFPNQNGLSHMAAYTLEGAPNKQPVFPYALCFVPNPRIRNRIGTPAVLSTLSSLHRQMELIDVDEILFNIVAVLHPKVLETPELLYDPTYARSVGYVQVIEKFRESQFGDSRLFFQHQPFEDDLLLRRDWLPYMTLKNMVKEGAFGAYKILFTPPVHTIQSQVETLKTLTSVFTRLFSNPREQTVTLQRLAGIQNLPALLNFAISQGAAQNYTIMNHQDFWPPVSIDDRENGMLIASTPETGLTHFAIVLSDGNYKNIRPNNWPQSVPIDLQREDTFTAAWVKFGILTTELQNFYQTTPSTVPLRDFIAATTNIGGTSLLNLWQVARSVVLGHQIDYLNPTSVVNRFESVHKLDDHDNTITPYHDGKDNDHDNEYNATISYIPLKDMILLSHKNETSGRAVMDHHKSLSETSSVLFDILFQLTSRETKDKFSIHRHTESIPEATEVKDYIDHTTLSFPFLRQLLQNIDRKLIVMQFLEPVFWSSVASDDDDHEKYEQEFKRLILHALETPDSQT